MFGRLLACLLLSLCCSSAWALSVTDYVRQRDGSDVAAFRRLSDYITGVGAGYIWANSRLTEMHAHLLYCQPQPIHIDADLPHIIDEEIGQPYVLPDYPIELMLLAGLARRYPCAE